MNILQISKHMNDSGVNSHIIELSHKLKLKGHHVIVVSSGGPHENKLTQLGIAHYKISFTSKNPLILIANLIKLIKIIKSESIEIAHTHWRSTGIYIKVATVLTGIDFVWSNHSNHIPSNWLYKKFTFTGKKVITVSTDMLPMLQQKLGIPREKIKVVYNGIDSDDIQLKK